MGAAPPLIGRPAGRARVCGILGYPLGHTLSPRMHQAAFAALGLDWAYVAWPVPPDRLAEAVGALRRLDGFAGANVTVPHKEAILGLLDALSEEARAVGAANTVVLEGGRLVGHTTDGAGLLAALAEAAGFRPRGARAVIVGAGGAGRSAAFALAAAGARNLAILNRSAPRATALADQLGHRFPETDVVAYQLQSFPADQILGSADLVLNATSVGMHAGDPSPVSLAPCPHPALAFDMVYHPPETAFLREARARGMRAANGLKMLLHQGAAAFALWTGRPAPLAVMRRALEAAESP